MVDIHFIIRSNKKILQKDIIEGREKGERERERERDATPLCFFSNFLGTCILHNYVS